MTSRVLGPVRTPLACAASCRTRPRSLLDIPLLARPFQLLRGDAALKVFEQAQQPGRQLTNHGRYRLARRYAYVQRIGAGDAIAAAASRPQDVVGLHFFSPANVMRLLEVVVGKATAPDALATGVKVGKRLSKLPVVTGNAFGFIGNRVYSAYRRQCEFLIEEGAWPEQVDAALESFGFAVGPFAVADLSGLDIAWRMRQAQAATRDPSARYVSIPDRLCEAGRLGRKSGAGYYRYDKDGQGRQVDEAVHALIEQASADKGLKRRALADEEIQRRALLAIVNEAALLLAEGVAARATDVDVVLVNGYGFPRWEGGAVFWARERGEAALRADLDWLAGLSGPGFVRGDVRHVLAQGA